MKQYSLEEAKEHLCKQAWELGEPCDAALLTRIFHAAHFRSTPVEEEGIFSSGPIVYIMFVALFYLVVVLVLISTNRKKTREAEEIMDPDRVQVVDYVEGRGSFTRVVDTVTLDEEEVVAADPV